MGNLLSAICMLWSGTKHQDVSESDSDTAQIQARSEDSKGGNDNLYDQHCQEIRRRLLSVEAQMAKENSSSEQLSQLREVHELLRRAAAARAGGESLFFHLLATFGCISSCHGCACFRLSGRHGNLRVCVQEFSLQSACLLDVVWKSDVSFVVSLLVSHFFS